MTLIRTPHIPDVDRFYAELIDAQRDLDDDAAQDFSTQLVLILANHVGDRSVLGEALALARETTLRQHARAASGQQEPRRDRQRKDVSCP